MLRFRSTSLRAPATGKFASEYARPATRVLQHKVWSGPGTSVNARLVLDFEFSLHVTRQQVPLGVRLDTVAVTGFNSQLNGQSALNGTLDYRKGVDANNLPIQDLFGPFGFLAPYVCDLGPLDSDRVDCSAANTVVSDEIAVPVGTAFPVRLSTHSYVAATNDYAEAQALTRLTLGDGVLQLPPGYAVTLEDGSPVPDYDPATLAAPESVPALAPTGLALLVGALAATGLGTRRFRRGV